MVKKIYEPLLRQRSLTMKWIHFIKLDIFLLSKNHWFIKRKIKLNHQFVVWKAIKCNYEQNKKRDSEYYAARKSIIFYWSYPIKLIKAWGNCFYFSGFKLQRIFMWGLFEIINHYLFGIVVLYLSEWKKKGVL